LHEILHRGSSRRLNHLFQILCRSVEGFRICAGSNFAILPSLSRSPLTQGWPTAQPVIIEYCRIQLWNIGTKCGETLNTNYSAKYELYEL